MGLYYVLLFDIVESFTRLHQQITIWQLIFNAVGWNRKIWKILASKYFDR